LSGLGAVVAVVWNIRGMVASFEKKISDAIKSSDDKLTMITDDIRAEFNANLKVLEQEQASKRDTFYRRFDEHKKFIDDTFVRNKECVLMHTTTSNCVESLRIEMKELRKEVAEVKELMLKR
jgi:hypothetical protein